MRVASRTQRNADRAFYTDKSAANRFVAALTRVNEKAARERQERAYDDLLQSPGAPRHYVLDGKVPRVVSSFREWVQQFEQRTESCKQGADIWRVGRTDLPNGGYVSTVFLGLDHAFMGGPPMIFETMTFLPGDEGENTEQLRYSTWEEAEAGHADAVERHTHASKAARKLKGAE
jgi:hypothetical protein